MAYYTAIRYGYDKLVGGFLSNVDGLRRNQKVIIHTDRGVEVGEMLRTFDGDIPVKLRVPMIGEVLRVASETDLDRSDEIKDSDQVKEYKFAYDVIERLSIKMKLIRVEHLFGGDKIIFFFMADGRVDFRELVRTLAREFRTRIEMRQIGVRDEAKMKGSCEMCGEELCCKKHLRQLEPVSMSMAKNQMKSLDPTRLSGRCGRLRCCLAYEDPVYTMLKKELPKIGTKVDIGILENRVVAQIPLKGEVVLVNQHRIRTILSAEDVRKLIKDKKVPTGPDTRVRTTGDTKMVAHLSDETEIRSRVENPKADEAKKGSDQRPKGRRRRRRKRPGGKGQTGNSAPDKK